MRQYILFYQSKKAFMKFLLMTAAFLTVQGFQVFAQSPLGAYDKEWDNARYSACNTAASAAYMTAVEREVIYILNLVRMYPRQFANTVLKKYPQKMGSNYLYNSTYYITLLDTLLKIDSSNLLRPDKKCFLSAATHAFTSGKKGTVGHERLNTADKNKEYYNGECIDYGASTGLDIVLSLLIDEGVPSLGHRSICLSGYTAIGVAIRDHNTYRHNSVLDFHF
jgi:hypothetical protein